MAQIPFPALCAVVTAPTLAELRARRDEAAREADLVELRLDTVADPDVAGALQGRTRPGHRDLPGGVGGRVLRGHRRGAAGAARAGVARRRRLCRHRVCRLAPRRLGAADRRRAARRLEPRLHRHAGGPGGALPRDGRHRRRGREAGGDRHGPGRLRAAAGVSSDGPAAPGRAGDGRRRAWSRGCCRSDSSRPGPTPGDGVAPGQMPPRAAARGVPLRRGRRRRRALRHRRQPGRPLGLAGHAQRRAPRRPAATRCTCRCRRPMPPTCWRLPRRSTCAAPASRCPSRWTCSRTATPDALARRVGAVNTLARSDGTLAWIQHRRARAARAAGRTPRRDGPARDHPRRRRRGARRRHRAVATPGRA